jgi:hypothetical protein
MSPRSESTLKLTSSSVTTGQLTALLPIVRLYVRPQSFAGLFLNCPERSLSVSITRSLMMMCRGS